MDKFTTDKDGIITHDSFVMFLLKIFFPTVRWTAVNAVKSAPGNSDRRNAIRQTWGSIKFLNGVRFETVFVIGQIDDNILQEKIRKEHEIFGDIAQTDIPDTKQ